MVDSRGNVIMSYSHLFFHYKESEYKAYLIFNILVIFSLLGILSIGSQSKSNTS